MELIQKYRRLAGAGQGPSSAVEIAILKRCNGRSGEEDVAIQRCLTAAATVDSMTGCLDGDDGRGEKALRQ